MNPFLYRLTLVHARLDAEVRREHKRRFPDNLRLLRLKRLRLAIKDRMHQFLHARRQGMA